MADASLDAIAESSMKLKPDKLDDRLRFEQVLAMGRAD